MIGSDDDIGRELRRLEEAAVEPMLPADDLERLAALPQAKRLDANRRLAVLRGWHSPSRSLLFRNAADAGKRLGLSRRGFFNLLKQMEVPSLDGLGLYLHRNGPEQPPAAGVSETAAELLRNDPATRATDLVRVLSEGAGVGLSSTTLLRKIDDVRRHAPASGPFGEVIAFDAASMDLTDEAGLRLRLYAAVDVNTGLMLGWSITPDERFGTGYATAAAAMPAVCGTMLGNLAASAEPLRLEASVPLKDDVTGRKFTSGGWIIVFNRRRIGRRVLAAVGRDIAGVRLAAGFAPSDVIHRSRVPAGLPVATPALIERIGHALAEHNAVRKALAPAGSGELARAIAEKVAGSVRALRL